MSSRLSEIFGELGISQHLDAFVDQGFDTWETVLDITESDLDALGVKLGHRRKLQRRIANARGIPSNAILASPTRPSTEDIRSEASQHEVPTSSATEARDLGVPIVQKRKYRRHPKPDENAPERPPSAYVLFSNKMRDDLKGQNLTFTEIAKLVGENWQSLTQVEKEPFERQAQAAKDKYNHDLAEYKQTPGYKKYLHYLQDFKAKHAISNGDKDGAKRARLSGSIAARLNGTYNRDGLADRAGSIADGNGLDQPAQRQRLCSITSNAESSYYAPSLLSVSARTPTEDCNVASPNAGYFERRELSPTFSASPRDSCAPSAATLPLRRELPYLDESRNDGSAPSRHLPPLSNVFEHRPMSNGAVYYNNEQATSTQGIPAMLPRAHQTVSPAPITGTPSGESRPPSLRKEQSSAGSISSGSSYSSYPRTPTEGPLPIHALLTNAKQSGPLDSACAAYPAIFRSMSPDDRAMVAHYPSQERLSNEPTQAVPPMPHSNGYYSGLPLAAPSRMPNGPPTRPHFAYNDRHPPPPPLASAHQQPSFSGPATGVPTTKAGAKSETGLDGISALLQADRIVDERR